MEGTCSHVTCRTFCKCKKCLSDRRKVRFKWYFKKLKNALLDIFTFKYKREIVSVRISEIQTHFEFDIGGESKFEWALLKRSIKKKGLEHPIILVRIKDLDIEVKQMEKRWMKSILDGYYYLPLDGHHRVATMKHLYKDNMAVLDAVIIPVEDMSIYTATYTPDLWCRDTDYGKIIKELDEIN